MQMLGEVPLQVEKAEVELDEATNTLLIKWKRPRDKMIKDSIGKAVSLRNFPITDYEVLVWVCDADGKPKFRTRADIDEGGSMLEFRHVTELIDWCSARAAPAPRDTLEQQEERVQAPGGT